MNQFPPSSRVFRLDRFEFFRKFTEIFASQGAPPVSMTPVANLPPVSTTPAAKLLPVSTTPVANLPPVSATPVSFGFDGFSSLKGQSVTRFLASGFFHESVSPQRPSILFVPFRIFSKIRGDIRESRCTTSINDTGGKFATGVNNTGGKIAAGINEAGGKFFHHFI
jgi:hypothetical protein